MTFGGIACGPDGTSSVAPERKYRVQGGWRPAEQGFRPLTPNARHVPAWSPLIGWAKEARVKSMESPSLKFRESTVKSKPLPRHVGIIMDGNGRWAESRGRPRLEGHREGSASVRDVTRCARRTGIEALTLYAFSAQNWKRPPLEVTGLM